MMGTRPAQDPLETNPLDATQLLVRVNAGDSAASQKLLPIVYEHLRALAGSYFRGKPAEVTLQPTALVHEAYLKLVQAPDNDWRNRTHFCAVAATAMRQILHDRSRRRRALKRGGGAQRLPLEQMETPSGGTLMDMVALDDALERLAALDPRQARIVELRFFGGLTTEQIAHLLEVSTRTIEKEWRRVRAWLNQELSGGPTA